MSSDFHKLYYNDLENTWETTTYKGVWVRKNPCDLWMYQELIWDCQPTTIIETGTAYGGSALWFAQMVEQVITIDIMDYRYYRDRPDRPNIRYVSGSSTDPEVFEYVKHKLCPNDRVMVVLDAEHTKEHVDQELQLWPQLVTEGQYLVVEDTNINGHPVLPEYGPGPMEALAEWLPNHPEFEVDLTRERYYLTFNPQGWLRRIKT